MLKTIIEEINLKRQRTQRIVTVQLPRRPEVFNSPRQILTLLNKVPGYWLQGETDLANKPKNMQIFPHLKIWDQSDRWLKSYGLKILILGKVIPKNWLLHTPQRDEG